MCFVCIYLYLISATVLLLSMFIFCIQDHNSPTVGEMSSSKQPQNYAFLFMLLCLCLLRCGSECKCLLLRGWAYMRKCLVWALSQYLYVLYDTCMTAYVCTWSVYACMCVCACASVYECVPGACLVRVGTRNVWVCWQGLDLYLRSLVSAKATNTSVCLWECLCTLSVCTVVVISKGTHVFLLPDKHSLHP